MTTNKLVHKQDEHHVRRGSLRKERNHNPNPRHVVTSNIPKATELQQQYERNFNEALNRWLADCILQNPNGQGKDDVRYKLLTNKEVMR